MAVCRARARLFCELNGVGCKKWSCLKQAVTELPSQCDWQPVCCGRFPGSVGKGPPGFVGYSYQFGKVEVLAPRGYISKLGRNTMGNYETIITNYSPE